jgi:hypothetical protein|tara:strand:- start:138 stop:401 length:264 start_codon:yes stop_codon:yes gene_type:complete
MSEAAADMANMAAELIHAKMESAKADGRMTHVLRIGTFHMELVPDSDINVEAIFNTMIDKLMKKYGEKLLQINIQQIKADAEQRHYG